MRTHIHVDELMAMAPCPEFENRARIVSCWNGAEQVTLEVAMDPPNPDISGQKPPDARENVWMLVHLMTRAERLEFGVRIINEVEELSPNSTVRDSLDLMTLFIGENSSEQEVATQREIVEALLHETEQETQLYKMVNATRQLMNPTESRKSIMRICRFIENHHPNATYAKFTNFAIQILKEEI